MAEIGEGEADILLSERMSQKNSLNCGILIQNQDTLYPLVFVSVVEARKLPTI